ASRRHPADEAEELLGLDGPHDIAQVASLACDADNPVCPVLREQEPRPLLQFTPGPERRMDHGTEPAVLVEGFGYRPPPGVGAGGPAVDHRCPQRHSPPAPDSSLVSIASAFLPSSRQRLPSSSAHAEVLATSASAAAILLRRNHWMMGPPV